VSIDTVYPLKHPQRSVGREGFSKESNFNTYEEALKDIINLYNTVGFKITEIRCNNKFCPLKNAMIEHYHIAMNFANPQEHVPEAERNNWVIKEQICASYYRLPFQQLTKTMTQILVMDLAKKLNFFPAKNGISSYYSPRMILHQKNFNLVTCILLLKPCKEFVVHI
jgi:hypothetical protein